MCICICLPETTPNLLENSLSGNAQGKYQGLDVIGQPKDLLMYTLNDTPLKITVKQRRLDSVEIGRWILAP